MARRPALSNGTGSESGVDCASVTDLLHRVPDKSHLVRLTNFGLFLALRSIRRRLITFWNYSGRGFGVRGIPEAVQLRRSRCPGLRSILASVRRRIRASPALRRNSAISGGHGAASMVCAASRALIRSASSATLGGPSALHWASRERPLELVAQDRSIRTRKPHAGRARRDGPCSRGAGIGDRHVLTHAFAFRAETAGQVFQAVKTARGPWCSRESGERRVIAPSRYSSGAYCGSTVRPKRRPR